MSLHFQFREGGARARVAWALLLVFAGVGSAVALTVHARQIAATHGGDPNAPVPVWETAIACSAETAIAVFNAGWLTQPHVAYGVATYNPNGEAWEWDPNSEKAIGWENPLYYVYTVDPSVACDRDSGRFIAAAFGRHGDEHHLVVSDYDPSDAEVRFDEWRVVASYYIDLDMDKAYLVLGEAGDPNDPNGLPGREYYITWSQEFEADEDRYGYARSIDGGQTWTAEADQMIKVGDDEVVAGWGIRLRDELNPEFCGRVRSLVLDFW